MNIQGRIFSTIQKEIHNMGMDKKIPSFNSSFLRNRVGIIRINMLLDERLIRLQQSA